MRSLLSLLILPFIVTVSAGAGETDIMDQVIAAWKKRQERAISFHCVVKQKWLFPAGNLSRDYDEMTKRMQLPPTPNRGLIPANDLEIECKYDFRINGKQFYMEYDRVNASMERGIEIAPEKVSENNGKSISVMDGSSPTGSIRPVDGASAAKEPPIVPIITALRGLDRKYSIYHPSDWKPGGQKAIEDGIEMHLFVPVKSQNGGISELWLAPAQDWLPVKTVYGGKTRGTEKITNQHNEVVGWLPQMWENTDYYASDGQLHGHTKCTMEIISFNSEDAEKQNKVAFPAGIKVYEDAPGKKRKEMMSDDSGRLIDINTGKIEHEEQSHRWHWLVTGLVVITVLLVIVTVRYVIRRGAIRVKP